jgi:hypothetical protein
MVKSFPQIQIKTLSDLLPGKTPEEMRGIVESYEPSLPQFEEKLQKDPHLQEELKLLIQRLRLDLDHAEGKAHINRFPLDQLCRKLLHRSLQYSSFLKNHRPKEAIRLSVHYQSDVSTKMGIKLSPHSFITPWHGVLVVYPDGKRQIMHAEDRPSGSRPQVRFVEGIPLFSFKVGS